MHNRRIKLRFQNGLLFKDFKQEVFDVNGVSESYVFEESNEPDFIIFGPYGNDIPPKSDRYTRIGYYCENVRPDMSLCEWAFGIPREQEINDPRYKRIQWHGLDPESLIKPEKIEVDEIFSYKTKFCNFLYSHRVPYREEFFRALSKYKKVDAPGKSMNNVSSIDELCEGDIWQRKRQFLLPYKFTISFENYVYPGYQTEKLYDAMLVNSVPIYCGDPFIGDVFNTKSFINTSDFINTNNSVVVSWLEKKCQPDFVDIRPAIYKAPAHRIKRKLKTIGRQFKMWQQFQKLNFKPLIDRIIELDQDDEKYLEVLKQPWFVNNHPPLNSSLKSRWIEIFSSPCQT